MGKKDFDAQYEPKVALSGSKVVPGKWNSSENRRYLHFLLCNKHKFNNKKAIREERIYKAMSDKIVGRTSDQCRGHHRKMMQRYKTIDNLIEILSTTLSLMK